MCSNLMLSDDEGALLEDILENFKICRLRPFEESKALLACIAVLADWDLRGFVKEVVVSTHV